jgi:SAM-dependent methyltransferase
MRHRQLFIARGLPVFQNKMFTDQASAIACPTGDIVLVQDMETGLIFNAAFDERLLQYDVDYQNEQAHSSYFQAHLANVGSIVDRHFSSKSLIEVGCGKGYFLEYLADAGYNITGIDPVYEGDNPNIIKAPFESKLGKSADGIILRHVLEHISDPLAFLEIVAEANGRQGLIYIEVPCFDWICENNAWFDIFYEHVNYFRLDDFQNIFGSIREIGRVFGGQYQKIFCLASTKFIA